MTDRGSWVTLFGLGGNVRRLMYQPLIWPRILGNDPRCLRTALDTEDRQRLANSLVDGMGRNPELGGDFLGAEMLVDEAKAIELGGGQFRDTRGEGIFR